MRSRLIASLAVVAAACAFSAAALADSLAVVAPRPIPGPYPVQCSDVAQDFTRVAPGLNAQNYWEATAGGYITDLLSEPAATPTVSVTLPNDSELFGSSAGKTIVDTLIVCAPTSPANPRPDYPLPSGHAVPHMMRAGEAPIWPDATTRFPVILYSHGLRGSPISGDDITGLTTLASSGYVVIAPFHGDPRFANISLSNIGDYLQVLLNFGDYTAMQAERPVVLSRAIDVVFSDPNWGGRLDATRIGGFGASLGGESMMLLAGAQLTVSLGLASRQVIYDPRLTAIVGYVPYSGQLFFPAFGRDNAGAASVNIPVMAISGTADPIAPLAMTEQAFGELHSARELVALQGVGHYFDVASIGDIFTWSLTWLDAYTAGDRNARATMQRMTQVAGGGNDVLLIDYNAPATPIGNETPVIEFYNAALNHFFITGDIPEALMLDAGVIVPGWVRTGFDFKAWVRGAPEGQPVCRFFGTPGIGPSSHFYTVNANECALVMSDPHWMFEAIAFNVVPPVGEDCPAGLMEVWRMYNNGMGGQANHRFLTSHSEIARMQSLGWLLEGAVFCTPP